MLRFRHVLILLFALLALFGIAQGPADVQRKLIKRYGSAKPWGKGFIVKAKTYYGLASSSGRIIVPINNYRFDTLLPGLAIVCGYQGCVLMNAGGKIVTPNSGIYDYRVVNRKKRLLASVNYEDKQLLCDDKGRNIITEDYNAAMPKESLLTLTHYTGEQNLYGIITAMGDTVLPPKHQNVSHGKNLYSFIRNDTAFVYNRKGKLLFSKSPVHGCTVLANDFVVLNKYGALALAGPSGRLLTGFKYPGIQVLNYADTTIWWNKNRTMGQGLAAPALFLTGNGELGVIDSSGKEKLPMTYRRILMNRRGWFILGKEGHEFEELVNPKLKRVLQTESYGLSFINNRYVSVKEGSYSDEVQERIYDMALNRFTDKHLKTIGREEEYYSNQAATYDYPDYYNNRYYPDSIIINEIGTALLKKNGRWGLRSYRGDTILPFIYDTAGQYRNYFVGNKGRFALLNWEGNLATPMELQTPTAYIAEDSLVYAENNQVYSVRGWHLHKPDPEQEEIKIPGINLFNGVAYSNGNTALPRGFYNRQMKRLAIHPYPPGNSNPNITFRGHFMVKDSAQNKVALMDSLGRCLSPWFTVPKWFSLQNNYAIAINDTGRADLLLRFLDASILCDTVWLDSVRKKNMLYPQQQSYVNKRERETRSFGHNLSDWNKNLLFEKKGQGFGIITEWKAALIPGAEKLRTAGLCIVAAAHGKWGLYTPDGKQLLAPDYDSINEKNYGDYCKLYKNGKTGIFDLRKNKLYEAIYDSVGYMYSLQSHFFIGYINGLARFVDANGRVISNGWQGINNQVHYYLNAIPAKRNGKNYLLYPTAGDSLLAIEDSSSMPAGTRVEEDMGDGNLILSKENFKGLYDTHKKSWLIAPDYFYMEKRGNFLVALTLKPETTTMFTIEGIKMFSCKGLYYRPEAVNRHQWKMSGGKTEFVVNCHGKVIVPPLYERVEAIYKSGKPLYKAYNVNDKISVIDTSGIILIPAILDFIDQVEGHNDYFLISAGRKYGLMNPDGKMIANCIYEDISTGSRPENYGHYYPHTEKPVEIDPYFIVSKGEDQNLKFGVLNKSGWPFVPCMYDSISQVVEGEVLIVKKDKYWGLVSVKNKAITEFKYDYIEFFRHGSARFRRGKEFGELLKDGTEQLFNQN